MPMPEECPDSTVSKINSVLRKLTLNMKGKVGEICLRLCNMCEESNLQSIFKYQDDLTIWLMIEMEKIPYFKNLTLQTK